jgi:hypothetical protein
VIKVLAFSLIFYNFGLGENIAFGGMLFEDANNNRLENLNIENINALTRRRGSAGFV